LSSVPTPLLLALGVAVQLGPDTRYICSQHLVTQEYSIEQCSYSPPPRTPCGGTAGTRYWVRMQPAPSHKIVQYRAVFLVPSSSHSVGRYSWDQILGTYAAST
jgi:hypothetical protein